MLEVYPASIYSIGDWVVYKSGKIDHSIIVKEFDPIETEYIWFYTTLKWFDLAKLIKSIPY